MSLQNGQEIGQGYEGLIDSCQGHTEVGAYRWASDHAGFAGAIRDPLAKPAKRGKTGGSAENCRRAQAVETV